LRGGLPGGPRQSRQRHGHPACNAWPCQPRGVFIEALDEGILAALESGHWGHWERKTLQRAVPRVVGEPAITHAIDRFG